MAKLRGATVGAGYFSQFHLEAWSRMDGMELIAICDADRQRAEAAAEKYGVRRVFTDYEQMLDEQRPDFIDIITRPESHVELTRLAAERSIDVICQKPLAPTFEEAQALVDVASSSDVRLMVHENFRFQPWYREIKKLLSDGQIGDKLHSLNFRARMGDGWASDAYLARQPYFRSMPRLLIYETGVHFVDTFRFLAGEIEGVYATLRKLNADIAGEDAGTVLFEFANGAQGIWDANRFNESNYQDPRYTFGEFLVEGNRGSIRLYADGRLTVQSLGAIETDHDYPHDRKNFASDCVYQTQQHFIQALLNGLEFETDGQQYLRTLRVQEAIYQSAETGQPVRGLVDANH